MSISQVCPLHFYVTQQPQSVLNRTFKIGVVLAKEALKVVAVVSVLSFIFVDPSKQTTYDIAVILIAPVVEEVIFRGVIQNGIRGIQALFNRVYPPAASNLANQRSFRIATSSVLFGAVHLTNWSHIGPKCIFQAFRCSIIGYQFAKTMEKTHTIAWAILEHGINNGLAVCLAASKAQPAVFIPTLTAFIALNIFNACSIYRGGITFGGYLGEISCEILDRTVNK